MELNIQWKDFLRIFCLYPLSQIGLIILLIVQLWGIVSGSNDASDALFKSDWAAFSVVAMNAIGIIVTIILALVTNIGFTLYYIYKSDCLFKLLNENRLFLNILNVVGLWFGGLSFLIMPIYLMIKVKDHHKQNGFAYGWTGKLK